MSENSTHNGVVAMVTWRYARNSILSGTYFIWNLDFQRNTIQQDQ